MEIGKYLTDLPDEVKEKTNIDELFRQLEKVKGIEKIKLLDEINEELNKLLNGQLELKLSEEDEKKVREIKEQVEKLRSNLEELKRQVSGGSTKNELLEEKVLVISEELEEKGLDGKDDEGIIGFFRQIVKWIENLLGFFKINIGSSSDKIASTFEKLGYGDKKDIEKTLEKIGDIKYKDLKQFYENLSKDTGLKVYLEKIEKVDNPFIPNFFEKYTDRLVNWVKDFFRGKVEFDNEKQKKVAAYIIFTIFLNREFLEKKVDNIKEQTVASLLSYIFPHGLSDFLRDYALPAEGVKLLNFKDNFVDDNTANVNVEKEKTFDIAGYKIIFKPQKEVVIEKDGKRYQFIEISMPFKKISSKDIKNLKIEGDKVIINLSNGKQYEYKVEDIRDYLKELDDNHLTISIKGGLVNIKFAAIS